jgi:ferredoxin
MIITEAKPQKEILEKLSGFKKIFIFGCGTCATKCATGGENEVKELILLLEKAGKKIAGWAVIESPCDNRLVKKTLREFQKELARTGAALVLACGAGVQNLAENLKIPVTAGLNSLFLGKIKNLRHFEEACGFCEECLLEETAGVCIFTSCPKKLLNGPCGGSEDGKCEVNPEIDCVWTIIYEKLAGDQAAGGPARLAGGQNSKLWEIKKPRNLSKTISPRCVTKK